MSKDKNPPPRLSMRLAFALARREMRGGLTGFRIFLLCLIMGITAIAAVGSMSASLVAGLAAQGQSILGGDLSLSLIHREADAQERAWIDQQGRVSTIATMRSMVQTDDNSALVEVKAIDAVYPLYGAVRFDAGGETDLASVLARRGDVYGALVAPQLLEHLNVPIGTRVAFGKIALELVGVLRKEPDSAGGGFGFAPRLLLSLEAFTASGLNLPGSLITHHYRIRLDGVAPASDVAAVAQSARDSFPDAGWRIRDRSDASPTTRRLILRVGLFLTLVGLTALVVGGVGVGTAIGAYLDSRRETIATLKCLGATGGFILRVYVLQILLLAFVAVVIGLSVGAALPLVAGRVFADSLPIAPMAGIYWQPLLAAAGFGVLVALAFALWPLGRARDIPAASLFRDRLTARRTRPRLVYLFGIALCFIGLLAIAIVIADRGDIALWFALGVFVAYVALRMTGALIMRVARRVKRVSRPELRMALRNMTRPDAPTQAVVLSMGLAVALLSTITMIDGNISAQIDGQLPDRAPSFFMLDIQPTQIDAIAQRAAAAPGFAGLEKSPMLRGKLMSINGVAAENITASEDVAWVLQGDRGLTYEAEPPRGIEIIEGAWWPPDYTGPPLLSIDHEIAQGLGVRLGDKITMNVLGRRLTATVANTRRVEWESGGINFVVIFSPEPLRRAPHGFLLTVHMDASAEGAFRRAISRDFPNVTVVRVKDALDQIGDMVRGFGTAVRLMSVLTVFAGVFVLAGAMASGHRARVYDAVVMKVLGATRRRILVAYVLEYMLIGAAASVIAALAGTLASWALISFAMQADWVFMPGVLGATVLLATVSTVILGLLGTYSALGQPTAPILRDE